MLFISLVLLAFIANDLWKTREFGTLLLGLGVSILYVLKLDIPKESYQLLLISIAGLLVTYDIEKGIIKLTNQEFPLGETWYNSKRYGMVVIAFVFTIVKAQFDIGIANYIIQGLIALFGIIGVFGFSMADLGEVVNPKEQVLYDPQNQ